MLETPLLEQHPSQTLPEPFLFVPISGPEASKGRGAAKQVVRAHVTRVQHSKSSTLTYTRNLETWTVNPQNHRTQLGMSEGQSQIPRKKAVSKKVAAKRTTSSQVAAAAALRVGQPYCSPHVAALDTVRGEVHETLAGIAGLKFWKVIHSVKIN